MNLIHEVVDGLIDPVVDSIIDIPCIADSKDLKEFESIWQWK